MNVGVSMIEWISASTAGVVNLEFGFQPDFVINIQNHGGTNPNIWVWANSAEFAGWAAALGLLVTGSTGVVTRDTGSFTVYAGGDVIEAVETENSDPKHVGMDGTAAITFRGAGISSTNHYVTSAGLIVPADHQTNSGRNLTVAFRANQ